MDLLKSYVYVVSTFVLLLFFVSCTTSEHSDRSMLQVRLKKIASIDPKYKDACGPIRPPKGCDVAAGRKPTKAQVQMSELGNDLPGEIWYEGTHGVVTQFMQAVPRARVCRLGGKVIFSLPERSHFNKECCPPGLRFSKTRNGVIEGTPTRPGRYTTTVVL